MKKLIAILLLCSFQQITEAQSWQQSFEALGSYESMIETSDGDLHITFNIAQNESATLMISAEGDSLGTEYFTPSPTPYYTLELGNTGARILKFFSSSATLISQHAVNVSWPATVQTTKAGLAIIINNDPNASASTGQLWIYDSTGHNIYGKVASEPHILNAISAQLKSNGNILIETYSNTGWLPQGAASSIYKYYLLDEQTDEICNESGNSSIINNSSIVADLAINGAMNCGSIGIKEMGLNDPSGPEGQFIPCTDFLFPIIDNELPIPHELELIGLIGHRYAVAGIKDDRLCISKIDCAEPIEEVLCYVPQDQMQFEVICEGESLLVGDVIYKTEGFYVDTLINQYGCDSIIRTDLTVAPNNLEINPEIDSSDGSGYIILNTDCNDCQFEWSNGSMEEDLYDLPNGIYTVTITQNSIGCTLVDSFDLQEMTSAVQEQSIFDKSNFPSVWKNGEAFTWGFETPIEQNEFINIVDINGRLLDQFTIQSNGVITFQAPEIAGIYFLQYHNQLGVQSKKIFVW